MPLQPALRGIAFAVLLLRAILGHNELRRQRQDLLVAGGDDGGAKEGMEILRAAVRTFPGRTARAMDLARAKMFGAIQRDHHPPVQAPERVEDAFCFDGLVEQRIERGRWGAVQHQADIGIGWDGGHAEQGLAVRPSVPFRQCALMRQERRASHEEQREGGEADIRHRVNVVPRPFTLVGKTGADLTQVGDQGLQGAHQAIESWFGRCRQAKSTRTGL